MTGTWVVETRKGRRHVHYDADIEIAGDGRLTVVHPYATESAGSYAIAYYAPGEWSNVCFKGFGKAW